MINNNQECKYCGKEFKFMTYFWKDHFYICDPCYRKKQYIKKLRAKLRNRRNTKTFYIYAHYDKNGKCIYVGKTKDLISRQNNHISIANHKNKIDKIFYATVKNTTEMFIYEVYYINLLQPKYNDQYKTHDDLSFMDNVKKLTFKEYKK